MAILDEKGFNMPTYQGLLEQYQTENKDVYGQDVNTDPNSVIGQTTRTKAWVYLNLYQLAQLVYFNQYIDSAEGDNLDMLGSSNYSVDRLPATPAIANVNFTGTPGTVIPAGTTVGTADDVDFELIDDITLDGNGNGIGVVQSSNKDENSNVPANTINVLVDQINGVDSVNNPDTAEGGAEQETDENYRARIHLSEESPGGPTKNGIISALYKVPGVQLVQADWNTDWEKPNDQGDKPGSIHIYVQGGRNEAIGQMLFESYAYGVPLSGDIEYTATDIGGHKQVVRFSKAKSVNVYADIALITNSNFDASNDLDSLRTNLANYVTDVPMGEPINYKKFIQIALNIDGVDDCNIKIGTDKNNLSNANINLAKFNSGLIANPAVDIKVVVNSA